MDQEIRFCDVDGHRIAISAIGAGPPLVIPSPWISHIEADLRRPKLRAFMQELARDRTVVRYDRLGTGLSDRERDGATLTLDFEARTLAGVVDELGIESCDLMGLSCGGAMAIAFAHAFPERVRRIALYGSYADGTLLAPREVRASMLAIVRAHWGLGSRVLAEMFLPNGTPDERREWAEFQRSAASPEMAALLLELVYDSDVRAELDELDVPVQVMHRRGDRAVPFALGRELASRVRGARFVSFEGDDHLPWHGDMGAIVASVGAFLGGDRPAAPSAPANREPLSIREVEILKLVARGLSDRQIAEALVLSPHTVHRHVANIRTKLRQPTRTAAATEAARLQLI